MPMGRLSDDWPSGSEKDIIVLGDFNEQGSLHYFEEIGWESLNQQPTNLSSTETYDTLLIDPRLIIPCDEVAIRLLFVTCSTRVLARRLRCRRASIATSP